VASANSEIRFSIRYKLLIPYVVTLVVALAAVISVFAYTASRSLSESLDKRIGSMGSNLTSAISDALTRGQSSSIEAILATSAAADSDVVYETLVSTDGRVVASTEASVRGQILNIDDFERGALAVTEPTRRMHPDFSAIELDAPFTASGNHYVLRLGVSTRSMATTLHQAEWTTILMSLLVVVGGFWMYSGIINSLIIRPIQRVVKLAEQVASGNLSKQTIVAQSDDEIGQMLSATHDMMDYLSDMASVAASIASGDLRVQVEPRSEQDQFGRALRKMVFALHAIVVQFTEGAKNLSETASRLLDASTQQSASISEQASSIQQATATLQEIKTIVDQANDKANSVMQIAELSLDVSQAGQRRLDQSTEAMKKIKDQVEAIAENILDLSEKVVQVGEITDFVNGIAEESKVLAVNAAIEATTAGEAGKGFRIVANEVKNLAAQSKAATARVRSLLSEIQKATTATVMVTEEGSKRVESGAHLVQQIGENFNHLYSVIVESSNAARQIATSAHQQALGIEQIAQGMNNIAMVATQSVSSAHEQKNSAQMLSDLAHSFRGIVEKYRLN
jgi:methyl-accepting chemotaxis protein